MVMAGLLAPLALANQAQTASHLVAVFKASLDSVRATPGFSKLSLPRKNAALAEVATRLLGGPSGVAARPIRTQLKVGDLTLARVEYDAEALAREVLARIAPDMQDRFARTVAQAAAIWGRTMAGDATAEVTLAADHGVPAATIKTIGGSVEVRSGDGPWQEARPGEVVRVGDSVRTGEAGVAVLEFDDRDAASGAESTVVDMLPEAEIKVQHLLVARSGVKRRTGLVDLVQGSVRAQAHGWANGSIFAVRAGSAVCGIRGSAAVIQMDANGNFRFTTLSGDVIAFQIPVSSGMTEGQALALALKVMAALATAPAGTTQVTVDGQAIDTRKVPPDEAIDPALKSAPISNALRDYFMNLLAALDYANRQTGKLTDESTLAVADAFDALRGASKADRQYKKFAKPNSLKKLDRLMSHIYSELVSDPRLKDPLSSQ
ncbi:MAG: hypothetical protein HUU35_09060 [Armatimonadetes bacterium]|nr:hypothetical protein [Armatimonadota bacterium]